MPHKTRPSKLEEEYFTREDLEKRHRLHVEHEVKHQKELKEQQKLLHFGKCSRCGSNLARGTYKLIEADHCTVCETLVIKKSDIEKLFHSGHTILDAFLAVFGHETK